MRLMGSSTIQIQSAEALGGMPVVEETGDSFAANAELKAVAMLDQLPEGAWAVADDSGLAVDCLGGAPGIFSARYAGEEATDRANVQKLLGALRDVPVEQRSARFCCAISLCNKLGQRKSFWGECLGRIAFQPLGEEGFGYDPIFIPQGYEQSFAELGATIKDTISHRRLAIAKMQEGLGV